MYDMNPTRTTLHRPSGGLLAPRRRRLRGITLLEVVIALSAMTIGLMTALKCIGSSLHLERVNRESTLGIAEAKRLLGEVRGETEARLLATYDDDKSNDPDGAGTAPGRVVPLPGLGWSGANASGSCTVLLPYDNAGNLREDLDLPELGLPRDLDGDGLVDSADHSTDAIFLPVAVRVEWTGAQGQRQIVLRSIRWRP
jgi:hypothetical protein